MFDDGAGVDDGVGIDVGAGIDDCERPDEDALGDGGLGGDDRGRVKHARPIEGVWGGVEDASSGVEVADTEDDRSWGTGTIGEEILDRGEALSEGSEWRVGSIVVVAEDGPASGDRGITDDECVAAGADEADRVISSGHPAFSVVRGRIRALCPCDIHTIAQCPPHP